MADRINSTNGQTVVFGAGQLNRVGQELAAFGFQRAVILSTPHQAHMAENLANKIGNLSVGTFNDATMHTPVDVTLAALRKIEMLKADCIVAIGGGSTIGLGKAISLRTGLPQIAIPTTYAGSETTPILGQTEGGRKTTLTNDKVLPKAILYDPELVATLPIAMTVTSALNAMAHAAEALYAQNRSRESDVLALQGLRSFSLALPNVLENPSDLEAREETQRGAWACGTVLGSVGMALHHKLCHTLGGSFNLPHAETHAVILPHAIAYNSSAASAELAPISELLGGATPGTSLWNFAKRMNAPTALRDLGMLEVDIGLAVEVALSNPYWNPRAITEDGLRKLLTNAWAGTAPQVN